MTNQFTAENPNGIKFTVTLTYSLETWKQVQLALDHRTNNYALDELRRDISDLVRQAEKIYYPESDKKI